MSDYQSGLPVQTQLPGQVLPSDLIVKIGDASNPTTQMASVDVHGSMVSRIADSSGNIIASENISSSYWLQTVSPSNGPVAPGTAASYSDLIGGVYNATPPSLSNGQQSAVQLNINGALITSPQADITPVTQSITVQDTASTSNAEFNQTWFTGTPTTGSAASFAINTEQSIIVQISGSWTGTLVSEVSVDGGTNWIAQGIHLLGTPIVAASFTGNVIATINMSGKTNFRIRATAAMTGSATVKVNESLNASSIYITNALRLVDASTPTSTTQANIVAGTIAAATSNTALVVALSPNSPVPAGTNNIGFTNSNTYVSGNPVSLTNPMPVTVTTASTGTPIQAALSATSIAVNASGTMTYTVATGHTFSLERIWISAESRFKATITINGTLAYTAFNSSADPNVDIVVTAPPTLPAAATVVIVCTNLDGGATNFYATVEGNQVT